MTDHAVPRRSFLATTAATVAGAALGLSGAPALARAAGRPPATPSAPNEPRETAAAPHEVRLGVASYSLREFPRDKALEMVKALRTPYINFKSVHLEYDKTPAELAEIRTQVEAAGFKIVGGGTITFNVDTDEGVEKYFAYAKAAGMPTMVSTGAPAVLPRVEKFAKQYDIKVALHNHGPEDKNYPAPGDFMKIIKSMDRRMGLCIDVGHTARAGVDPAKAILDAGPRLHDVHMKDLTDLSTPRSQVAVGEGKLPIAQIFQALQAIRYPGYVNLEYEINSKDPLPGMQQSFAHMRGVLAGIAAASAAPSSAARAKASR